jgi:hypothetical protein
MNYSLMQKSAIIDDNIQKKKKKKSTWIGCTQVKQRHHSTNITSYQQRINMTYLHRAMKWSLVHQTHTGYIIGIISSCNILYHIPKCLSNSMYTIYKSFDSVMVHSENNPAPRRKGWVFTWSQTYDDNDKCWVRKAIALLHLVQSM